MPLHLRTVVIWTACVFAAAAASTSGLLAKQQSDTYVAAVVEIHPTFVGATTDEQLAHRVAEYVAHIDAAAGADIIVFPESTLTAGDQAQLVPEPTDAVVPCTNATYAADAPLARLSCAARARSMYVVINLTMRRRCDATINGRPCTDEWSRYNTNVVLDRSGAVISM